MLQSAAVADGSGAYELACEHRLVLRHVLQDLLEAEQHALRRPPRLDFAVYSRFGF